ncbi:MAG: glutathione S-transferase, partial [Rhodospirillaceae bacterium]|nr:glutathione S-transferase [Rhodospirillaceae bacterium]
VRNTVEFFAGRALAGPHDFEQIPALAERGMKRVDIFYELLNERLDESPFIAGDDYTIADIAALCAVDFARVVKKRIGEDQSALQRWYDAVSARPSAKA